MPGLESDTNKFLYVDCSINLKFLIFVRKLLISSSMHTVNLLILSFIIETFEESDMIWL